MLEEAAMKQANAAVQQAEAAQKQADAALIQANNEQRCIELQAQNDERLLTVYSQVSLIMSQVLEKLNDISLK